MEIVNEFNEELNSIESSRLPVSKDKIRQITVLSVLGVRKYKHIVYSMEKYIHQCQPKYMLPALYAIDSIVHESKELFGFDKDVYGPRFGRHLETTFTKLFLDCPPDDKPKIVRVLNLWQKDGLFSTPIIQSLLNLANLVSCQNDRIDTSSSGSNSPNDEYGQPSGSAYHLALLADTASRKEKIPLTSQLQELTTLVNSIKNSDSESGTSSVSQDIVNLVDESNKDKHIHQNNLFSEYENLPSKSTKAINWTSAPGDNNSSSTLIDSSSVNSTSPASRKFSLHLRSNESSLNPISHFSGKRSFESCDSAEVYLGSNNNQSVNKHFRIHRGLHTSESTYLPESNPHQSQNENSLSPRPFIKSPRAYDSDDEHEHHSKHANRDFRTHENRQFRFDRQPVSPVYRKSGTSSGHQEKNKVDPISFPPLKKDNLTICSTTLWIGSLSPNTNNYELKNIFSEFGTILQIYFKRGAACAYVCFDTRANAARAYISLRSSPYIGGNNIKLGWAPGHGLKNGIYHEYYLKNIGCAFIPHSLLKDNIDLTMLGEGGEIDPASVPDWLKEPGNIRDIPKKENVKTKDPPSIPMNPYLKYPQMFAPLAGSQYGPPRFPFPFPFPMPSQFGGDPSQPFGYVYPGMPFPFTMPTNSQPSNSQPDEDSS